MRSPVETKDESKVAGRIKVFLVCSGLGQVNRGFESFARECFDALSREPSLDLMLFKGGGISKTKEKSLCNTPRNQAWTRKIGLFLKIDPYVMEQRTFFLSLLPYLVVHQPDVVYFSDGHLGNLLWHWKKKTGAKYKILFSNGAPFLPPFSRWDGVQHLTPVQWEIAVAAGEPVGRQFIVPYGFNIPKERSRRTNEAQVEVRRRLNLPVNRDVVLCVGAISKSQKRTDYVIEEIARLPQPRPYLVLLGQPETEAGSILEFAAHLLGRENFTHRAVSSEQVEDYYRAADLFVLGSLREGFGRVVVEAMSHGLPCCVHDYGITRYVLGKFGIYGDFKVPGALTRCLQQGIEQAAAGTFPGRALIRAAYERFSWDHLRGDYLKMFKRCKNPNEEKPGSA